MFHRPAIAPIARIVLSVVIAVPCGIACAGDTPAPSPQPGVPVPALPTPEPQTQGEAPAPEMAVPLPDASAAIAEGAGPSQKTNSVPADYRLQPGDLLSVSVWKEPDLTGEVLVRPDGGLSFPLVGDLSASGKSVADVRQQITDRLTRYIPTPVVSVSVKTIGGNRIYVVGKVQHPGEFTFVRPLDVMQALSLAGGTNSFAALNHIVILHRENGKLKSIPFHYSEVERGKVLGQDILLASGDTVVVP